MHRTPLPAALVAAGLLLCSSSLHAGTPLGGLGVAVSPDGARLVIGGDSRTLYVVDARSLAVTDRIWSGTTIVRMVFNKDGTRLWVESSSGDSQILETEKFAVLKEMKRASYLAPARAADLVVALDPGPKGHALRVYSLTDGSEKGAIEFPKGTKVSSFGVDTQGKQLAVLTKDESDPEEPKVSSSMVPKELKGVAKEDWKQRNDGKTCLFQLYDLPAGTRTLEKKTWFTTAEGSLVFLAGGKAHVVNYSNLNARFDPAGEGELFELAHGFNYGVGVSEDHGQIYGGSMASGSRTTVADLVGVKFQIDRLPGWPEYFRGFAVGPDGTGYGTTSGYRLVRFGPTGTVDRAVPVF